MVARQRKCHAIAKQRCSCSHTDVSLCHPSKHHPPPRSSPLPCLSLSQSFPVMSRMPRFAALGEVVLLAHSVTPRKYSYQQPHLFRSSLQPSASSPALHSRNQPPLSCSCPFLVRHFPVINRLSRFAAPGGMVLFALCASLCHHCNLLPPLPCMQCLCSFPVMCQLFRFATLEGLVLLAHSASSRHHPYETPSFSCSSPYPWFSHPRSFPVMSRLSRFAAPGGVVLLGDAAHTVTPALGQGVNSALTDASLLADMLAKVSGTTGSGSSSMPWPASHTAAKHGSQLA